MIYKRFGLRARNENPSVEYAIPGEDYEIWMDNVVLLKDTTNRANAIKFTNFLPEPENAAEVTIFASCLSGVKGTMAPARDAIKQAPELKPEQVRPGSSFTAVQRICRFYTIVSGRS